MTPFGSDPFRLPPFRWPDRFAGPSANPQLASFHTDLINAGKPKKLALIAAMRQLLTILQSPAPGRHAMARTPIPLACQGRR